MSKVINLSTHPSYRNHNNQNESWEPTPRNWVGKVLYTSHTHISRLLEATDNRDIRNFLEWIKRTKRIIIQVEDKSDIQIRTPIGTSLDGTWYHITCMQLIDIIAHDPTLCIWLQNEGKIHYGIFPLIDNIGRVLDIEIEYTDSIVLHTGNMYQFFDWNQAIIDWTYGKTSITVAHAERWHNPTFNPEKIDPSMEHKNIRDVLNYVIWMTKSQLGDTGWKNIDITIIQEIDGHIQKYTIYETMIEKVLEKLNEKWE
jgi:hypothetical protein